MEGLDALRGIAVTWVVWHNCTYDFSLDGIAAKVLALITNSGWLGVQLFFVLSGFLITGLLLETQGHRNQLRFFYVRRTLRIFPLYYTSLIICLFALPLLGIEWHALLASRENQLWFWLYLNNWASVFVDPGIFSHFWSLAIEEQFYLLWPWLVVGLSRRHLAVSCLLLIALAIATRFTITYFIPAWYAGNATYTFTVARCDALAAGCLLAVLMRDPRCLQRLQRLAPGLFWGTLGLIACIVLGTQNFEPRGLGISVLNQSLAAIFFAFVIFFSVLPAEPGDRLVPGLHRVLQLRFLNIIGKYSYAIYIIHGVLKYAWLDSFAIDTATLTGFRLWLVNVYNAAAVFSLSLLLAMLSWKLLEEPFLRLKRYFVP